MLDEFRALGRPDFFEQALAFMAAYRIKAFMIIQPETGSAWAVASRIELEIVQKPRVRSTDCSLPELIIAGRLFTHPRANHDCI